MSKSDPKKKGKTVEHKLAVMKKHPTQWLTKFCLLPGYDRSSERSDLTKAYALQRDLRRQYYRMINLRPEIRQKLTYGLNCQPTGFTVTPWTMPCKNRRICPWCFIRRAHRGYRELMSPGTKIRNLHSLLAWRRDLPLSDELPFFRYNYGPHQWCQAHITVQYVIPMLSRKTSQLVLSHVGFQLIPKEFDYEKAMTRRAVNPPVRMKLWEKANKTTIVTAMSQFMVLPWSDLVAKENLELFIQLYDWNPRAQLLRVRKAKTEGENRGN